MGHRKHSKWSNGVSQRMSRSMQNGTAEGGGESFLLGLLTRTYSSGSAPMNVFACDVQRMKGKQVSVCLSSIEMYGSGERFAPFYRPTLLRSLVQILFCSGWAYQSVVDLCLLVPGPPYKFTCDSRSSFSCSSRNTFLFFVGALRSASIQF